MYTTQFPFISPFNYDFILGDCFINILFNESINITIKSSALAHNSKIVLIFKYHCLYLYFIYLHLFTDLYIFIANKLSYSFLIYCMSVCHYCLAAAKIVLQLSLQAFIIQSTSTCGLREYLKVCVHVGVWCLINFYPWACFVLPGGSLWHWWAELPRRPAGLFCHTADGGRNTHRDRDPLHQLAFPAAAWWCWQTLWHQRIRDDVQGHSKLRQKVQGGCGLSTRKCM